MLVTTETTKFDVKHYTFNPEQLDGERFQLKCLGEIELEHMFTISNEVTVTIQKSEVPDRLFLEEKCITGDEQPNFSSIHDVEILEDRFIIRIKYSHFKFFTKNTSESRKATLREKVRSWNKEADLVLLAKNFVTAKIMDKVEVFNDAELNWARQLFNSNLTIRMQRKLAQEKNQQWLFLKAYEYELNAKLEHLHDEKAKLLKATFVTDAEKDTRRLLPELDALYQEVLEQDGLHERDFIEELKMFQ
ncbi:hypothetical protein [Motilimonas eburnea]|uniref:hypothetical protein n=1 Tax=Motilimonas eburnea TaxID=1737488 RepID=UPI001E2E5FF9|nr:hypothetical protein [Motilimonas eburnea]MCE2571677.1 hypothetical protein [Motilimonas eburnea]